MVALYRSAFDVRFMKLRRHRARRDLIMFLYRDGYYEKTTECNDHRSHHSQASKRTIWHFGVRILQSV